MSTTWLDRMRKRVAGLDGDLPWWVSDKLALNSFCETNDLPAPKIYKVWDNPDDITLHELPDEFVLKPNHMYSARGVMVLSRQSSSSYFDAMTKNSFSESDIRTLEKELFLKSGNKSSMRFFAEEKVQDEEAQFKIPLDYKIFVFYGKVLLVSQVNRNTEPKEFAWFDGDFDRLDLTGNISTNWVHIAPGQPVKPDSWQEMLQVAYRASKLLKTPFVTVDMYASTRGAILGELTLTPGGPFYGEMYKFAPELDRRLGDAWADAQFRIIDEGCKNA